MLATQLCLTLCEPMDYSPPGSSVHGISQVKIPEWVAIPFSRGPPPSQGSNPGLLHCRQILYCLSYQWRPIYNIYSDLFKYIGYMQFYYFFLASVCGEALGASIVISTPNTSSTLGPNITFH